VDEVDAVIEASPEAVAVNSSSLSENNSTEDDASVNEGNVLDEDLSSEPVDLVSPEEEEPPSSANSSSTSNDESLNDSLTSEGLAEQPNEATEANFSTTEGVASSSDSISEDSEAPALDLAESTTNTSVVQPTETTEAA